MYAKILLADDVRMFLEIQRHILEPLPVEIATAADGVEVLRLVDQFGPDLIVLDMNMPGMGGIECCRALKGHRLHRLIPVVMTVSAFGCDAELCYRAGSDAVLRKPLDAARYLETVTGFIPGLERRSRRVPLLAPVQVRTGERSFGGALLNISRSGACLEPDEELDLGATLNLSFELSSAIACCFELRARVVRLQRPDARGLNGGVGVAFAADSLPNQDLELFIRAGVCS